MHIMPVLIIKCACNEIEAWLSLHIRRSDGTICMFIKRIVGIYKDCGRRGFGLGLLLGLG